MKSNTIALDNVNRIDEIDIAKAVGIICVLIGHRTGGALHNYVYLFHMPLFFILSGLTMKCTTGGVHKLIDVVRPDNKLLSSYIVYSTIFIAFDYIRNPDRLIINFASTGILWGIHALWFLASLWITKCAVRIIIGLNNRKIESILIGCIYATCYWLSILLINTECNTNLLLLLKYIAMSWVRVGVVLPFVYIGYVFKDRIKMLISCLQENLLGSIIMLLLSTGILITGIRFNAVDYHLLQNGVFILDIVYGCIGFILVVSLSVIICKYFRIIKMILLPIGKNSIHFMASEFFSGEVLVSLAISCVCGDFNNFRVVELSVYFAVLYVMMLIVAPVVNAMISNLKGRIDGLFLLSRR